MRTTSVIVAMLLCGASVARAEPLDDVRAALARLQGGDAIEATLDVAHDVRLDASGRKPYVGKATLNLQATGQGIQLNFPPELMQQAENESKARTANPELAAPTVDALSAATPLEVARMVSPGARLLRTLDGATLKEARADTLDGKPVQLVVLDVPGHMSTKDKADLSRFEGRLKLWLDADGTPLASEETYQFGGRKFLIGFEGSQSISARYARVGARLIAKTLSSRSTFTGFGQDNDITDSASLTLR